MNLKSMILLMTMLLFTVALASAGDFSMRVSITTDDGEARYVTDGKTITPIAEPGEDNVEILVELENDLNDEADIDDVVVTAIIINVSGEINSSDYIDSFTITNGKTKEKTLQLDIPGNAEELKKEIVVVAEGVDENGTRLHISWHGFITINDPNHEIEITNIYANKTTVSCGESVNILAWVENRGSFDESAVVVTVEQPSLGFSQSSTRRVDQDDKDSFQSTFTIPSTAAPGKYPVSIKAYYKNTKLDDVDGLTLDVASCNVALPVEDNNDSAEDVAPVKASDNQPPAPAVQPIAAQQPSINPLLIGVGIAAIVIIAIVILSVLYIRKKN